MSEVEFKPLGDEESAISVGGLSLENLSDAVLVTGSVELTRDSMSVDRARRLSVLFASVADQLERDIENGLATSSVDEGAVTEIKNPF